jgi:hypothetical protein
MSTYTRQIAAVLGPAQTGLAGTLGYTVTGSGGSTLVARTTAGVTEVGPGLYVASVPWNSAWSGLVAWDAGSGVLAVEDFAPATLDLTQVIPLPVGSITAQTVPTLGTALLGAHAAAFAAAARNTATETLTLERPNGTPLRTFTTSTGAGPTYRRD